MSVGVERNRQKRSLVAVSVRFDILRSWKDAYIQTPDYSLQVKYKGEVTTTTENVYTCYMTQSFGSAHKASRWFFLGFPVRFLVIPKVTHVSSTVYSSHGLSFCKIFTASLLRNRAKNINLAHLVFKWENTGTVLHCSITPGQFSKYGLLF